MAVSSFGVVSLLVALLSGGAHDLLDFVSTDAYWKAKGVTVSVEQLVAELKTPDAADVSELVKNLGSGDFAKRDAAARAILARGPAAIPTLEKFADDPDPEVASRVKTMAQQLRLKSKAADVRRLMAIRTLGEMKKPEAVAALRALSGSKEMFVADYAARAVARIEGKATPARAVKAEALKSDLAILPANCAMVGQLSFAGGSETFFSFDEAIKGVPAQPGENRQAMLERMTAHVIEVADQIGNVRVESVSFGLADVIGPQDGFAAFVVRGQYDAPAVLTYLRGVMPPAKTVEGADVFSPDPHLALVFPGNDRALFMTGASADKLPVKELLTAIAAAGAGGQAPPTHPLLKEPALAPFVASLDGTVRMWAACKVSDSYRGAPVVQAFDVITMVGRQEKDSLTVRLAGSGTDPVSVKGAVDLMNQGLDAARMHLPQLAQQTPALQPIVDFVTGAKCTADDKNATLTGTFKGDMGNLLALPFMVFWARAEAVPGQPPAAVQPAPVVK